MENKINIAELLKDCPKGMELDCTMFDDIYFDYIDRLNIIHCYIQYETHKTSIIFNQHGTFSSDIKSKCLIFPKGKTTWKGFQRPFKDGDILTYIGNYTTTFIYRNKENEPNYSTSFYVGCSDAPTHNFLIYNKYTLIALNGNCDVHLATEEEKQKLFDAIKANGYKWNSETKTLEKLVEPKFKVGDKVLWNYNTKIIKTISKVQLAENRGYVYWIDSKGCSSGWWNENELTPIPNKFDITTLKPFDKVLVRLTKDGVWNATFFSHYDKEVKWGCYPFITTGSKSYPMCIPYNEDTKYLLGTTNDCDEFYKTW